MAQENVEVVRSPFDEAQRRGVVTGRFLAKYLHPDIEYREDPRLPEAGVYQGVDAVHDYWEQFGQNFDEFMFEAEDFVDIGRARVLVMLIITTRGRDSSASIATHVAWICTLRDGLISRREAFVDRADALEAAGLRE